MKKIKNKSKPSFKKLWLALLVGLGIAFGLMTQPARAVSNATQTGTVNGVPVYKANTSNQNDPRFQTMLDEILQSHAGKLNGVKYTASHIGWNANSQVITPSGPFDTVGAQGGNVSYFFGIDGYLTSDAAKLLNNGSQFKITNVGYVTEVETGKQIPVDLGITYNKTYISPQSPATNQSIVAAKGFNSSIHIMGAAPYGGGNLGGGDAEGGGSSGGNAGGVGLAYMQGLDYTATLIRQDNKQPLPSGQVLTLEKISDVDANQNVAIDPHNIAVITSPDTQLGVSGNAMEVMNSGATNSDSTTLNPNAYMVLSLNNSFSQFYNYNMAKTADDHVQIDTGLFGNYGNLELRLDGKLKLDKSTVQYGKNLPNNHYSFDPLGFDVLNGTGKKVGALDINSKGQSNELDVPGGTYFLRETATNWAATGQTQRPDIKVTVEAGKTTVIGGDALKNTAVRARLHIKKTINGFNNGLPNHHYNYEGIRVSIDTHDGKHIGTVTLDKNGEAWADLPLDEYYLREVKDSVTAETGQVYNDKIYKVNLTYKDQNTEVVTGSVELKNDPVLGQIAIDKTLLGYGKTLPNKLYGFEGIQFLATSVDGKVKTVLTMDKFGKALSDKVLLGEYDLQEIANSVTAATGQVVNPKKYRVTLTWKDNVTQVVSTTQGVENRPVLAEITIKKGGVESGTALWNANYNLANNTFKLTSKTDGKVYIIKTDALGIAKLGNLPLGKYWIEETAASAGFGNTFQPREVELTWKDNQTEIVYGETSGTNQEIKGQNTLQKVDKETGTKPHGNGNIKEAKYAYFHNDVSTGSSPHKVGDPVKWSEKPNPKILKGIKVTEYVQGGHVIKPGDAVVLQLDPTSLQTSLGNLSLGEYYAMEVDAGTGYVVDSKKHYFTIAKKDDQTLNIVTPDTKSEDQLIKVKIDFKKLAQIAGGSVNAGINGAEFTASPMPGTISEAQTSVTALNTVTGEDGYGGFLLDVGNFKVWESKGVPGYTDIKPFYIHVEHDKVKDIITITASPNEDFSNPFTTRHFSVTDNNPDRNPNEDSTSTGIVDETYPYISLSPFEFIDGTTTTTDFPNDPPSKDVIKEEGGDSMHGKEIALNSDFFYVLNSSTLQPRNTTIKRWVIDDDYPEQFDRYNGWFKVFANTSFGKYKRGDELPRDWFKAEDKKGHLIFTGQQAFFDVINDGKVMKEKVSVSIQPSFYRYKAGEKIKNDFVETINNQTENSNDVWTNTKEPEPHKFDLNKGQFDINGEKLLDDDGELFDRYADTNKDPYVDKIDNNEPENINTKDVEVGQTLYYQLWLDTKAHDNTSKLPALGMVDDFDEKVLNVNPADVKVYNAKGNNVTPFFKVTLTNGKLSVMANVFKASTNSKGEKIQIVDTAKLPFGQWYKMEMPAKVKAGTKAGVPIINVAKQVWTEANGQNFEHITEKRVNQVKPVPVGDIEKSDTNFAPAGQGNHQDKPNNAGSIDHDTKDSAAHLIAGQTKPIFIRYTNKGNEPQTNLTFKDLIIEGQASLNNWTYTAVGLDGKKTPLTLNAKNILIAPNGKPLVLDVGETVEITAVLSALNPGEFHADKASMDATGTISGKTIGDDDHYYGKTDSLILDTEKTTGPTVPKAGQGNYKDQPNNLGAEDHDTADTALVLNDQPTPITFSSTNLGEETWTHVKPIDKTIDGVGNVENLQWYLQADPQATTLSPNDIKLTVNQDGELMKGDQLVEVATGQRLIATGTLPQLLGGENHADQIEVTAKGKESGLPVGDKDEWYAKQPAKPVMDVEKTDEVIDGHGNGNYQDKANNMGESDHDTLESAAWVAQKSLIKYKITNIGNEVLSNIKPVDKTIEGKVKAKDFKYYLMTDAKTKSTHPNYKGIALQLNDKGILVDSKGKAVQLKPQGVIEAEATLELPENALHGNKMDVTGDGIHSNQNVGDDDNYYAKTPTDSIDIEKTNDEPSEAGQGNGKDKPNNVGANDHDTADTAMNLKPGDQTDLHLTITNNSNQAQSHIIAKDVILEGKAKLIDLKWRYKAYVLKSNKKGEFLDPTKKDGSLLVLQPNEQIFGTVTLEALGEGAVHADKASVSAIGEISGKPVGDSDEWHGKTPKPVPPVKPAPPAKPSNPLKPIINIYLPMTGDAMDILRAIGAWVLTIAGLIAIERKWHLVGRLLRKVKSEW